MNKIGFSFFLFFGFNVWAQPLGSFEGFFDPAQLEKIQTPIAAHATIIRNSVFKLVMGKKVEDPFAPTGTAFAIGKDGIFLTNVHNIRGCLREHDLVQSGYRGERGPLPCPDLILVDATGAIHGNILLLGSNSGGSGNSIAEDFAAVQVPGIIVTPMSFRSEKSPVSSEESVYSIGFPGQTHRSKQDLQNRRSNLLLGVQKIAELYVFYTAQENISLEELHKRFTSLFTELVPLIGDSEFLSATLLKRIDPLMVSSPEVTTDQWGEAFDGWFNEFMQAAQIMAGIFGHGLDQRTSDSDDVQYPNADGTQKLTFGKVHSIVDENHFLMQMDSRHGASGSPILDREGQVIGILSGITTERIYNSTCVLDNFSTGFSALIYSHCGDLYTEAVSHKNILRRLNEWSLTAKLP